MARRDMSAGGSEPDDDAGDIITWLAGEGKGEERCALKDCYFFSIRFDGVSRGSLRSAPLISTPLRTTRISTRRESSVHFANQMKMEWNCR